MNISVYVSIYLSLYMYIICTMYMYKIFVLSPQTFAKLKDVSTQETLCVFSNYFSLLSYHSVFFFCLHISHTLSLALSLALVLSLILIFCIKCVCVSVNLFFLLLYSSIFPLNFHTISFQLFKFLYNCIGIHTHTHLLERKKILIRKFIPSREKRESRAEEEKNIFPYKWNKLILLKNC